MPKFVNEAQEADWWASREGREFVKQKAAGTGKKGRASTRKGIGYQTLLKMLVHEGLRREARRA